MRVVDQRFSADQREVRPELSRESPALLTVHPDQFRQVSLLGGLGFAVSDLAGSPFAIGENADVVVFAVGAAGLCGVKDALHECLDRGGDEVAHGRRFFAFARTFPQRVR